MTINYLKYDSSIFEQLSNRELEFIWTIFRPDLFNTPIKSNESNLYNNHNLLPPISKIKIDLVNYFNKNPKRDLDIKAVRLSIINRLIEADSLNWIDKNNFQQINFILSKIKNTPPNLSLIGYEKEEFIQIPDHEDYKEMNNYFLPINYPNFKVDTPIKESYTAFSRNGNIKISLSTPPPDKRSKNEFENLIYYIDLLILNIQSKINFMEKIRIEWENHIKKFNPLYNWIDPLNETQINWAINYLEKKEKKFTNLFVNKENIDKYYELLILFDNIFPFYINPDYIKCINFFEKMKKSWGQQKYRDSGKIKKLYHLPLTKNTQTQLEKLAELKNTKKENIIEELIDQEYSKYTDSNGKFKY